MGKGLRLWWKKASGHTKTILLIAFISVLIGMLIFLGYFLKWGWTGFKEKTLWDWLNLLGVLAIPVVVGLGAAWYTSQQGKVYDKENKDNQREAALQAYIDKMSELLLEKNLRESKPEDEVRKIARVRTLTVLPRLDGERKGSVLQFLHESGLILKAKRIVTLSGADLTEAYLGEANLSEAYLRRANLTNANLISAILLEADLALADLTNAFLVGANLSAANLSGAILIGASLDGANLSEANLINALLTGASLGGVCLDGADLSGANLFGADLGEAKVTKARLETTKSLKGATMPDGSIHS